MKQKQSKHPFLYCDIIFSISVGLALCTHFITVLVFNIIKIDTAAEINSIAIAYEANPFMKMVFNLNKVGFIISNIILPAFLIGIYLHYRKKVKLGRMELIDLTHLTNIVFFMFLVNTFNDAAVLIGKLI